MLCPARCDCFLCRELQSCRAADARKPPNANMCDNFILRKADNRETSGALRFIRGAARLSVRHWQNRTPMGAPSEKTHKSAKSSSCERLCPPAVVDVRRTPSTDRVESARGPLMRFLGNARLKKTDDRNLSEDEIRRGLLDFKRSEIPKSNEVHEKYVPLKGIAPRDSGQPDKRHYGGRPACYDELARRLSLERRKRSETGGELADKITQNDNKVVIYFGDSIIRKHERRRDEEESQCVDGERTRESNLVSKVEVSEAEYCEIDPDVTGQQVSSRIDDATYKKETLATVMSSDGFLVVRFEENFECARRLVELVRGVNSSDHQRPDTDPTDDQCDWSFIQEWRKRPSSGGKPVAAEEGSWSAAPALTAARATRVRIPAPPAPPAHSRRLDPPAHAHHAPLLATAPTPLSPNKSHRTPQEEERDSCKSARGPGASLVKSISVPSQLTAQSTPVRAAPAQTSCGLRRPPVDPADQRVPPLQVQQDAGGGGVPVECGSSSDENRSSGHASMSDSGGADEPRRARSKHRPHNKLQSPWAGGGGLEDIRSAIKQLTLRSRDSSSTATSGASSGGHHTPAGGGAAEARRRRAPLVRQPSLDTVCTNVTSADEFVWVDSHNRLVELRCVPWSANDVSRALSAGRCRELAARLAADTPPRLAHLLQRALVRVAREAQRLSHNFGFCSKHEVAGAFRIVLSTPLADACIKKNQIHHPEIEPEGLEVCVDAVFRQRHLEGCQRAATMYATSGGAARRLGSAARARTTLAPGRFQRWMLDVRVASFIHEYAAIYLCAGMETLLEEVVMVAGASAGPNAVLTPALLEHAVATCADLWGLLQPYSHLNAGRLASGALSLSHWESASSLCSGSSPSREPRGRLGLSHDSGITTNGSGGSNESGSGTGSVQSVLLTTCAGSAAELRAVLRRAAPRHPPLTPAAERALYYFMRCSQLEHGSAATSSEGGGDSSATGVGGGLWGVRGAGALPPLGEWVRVARAHAQLRQPPHAPDADDVRQAARLLLPSADCPPRPLQLEESIEPQWSSNGQSGGEDGGGRVSGVAHRVLHSGAAGEARALLPAGGLDLPDAAGLTPLMKAAADGDEQLVALLLDAGADPNVETPGCGALHAALLSPRSAAASPAPSATAHTPSTAGWTALVYACAVGSAGAAARLLAAGARVDGAPSRSDHVCTLTPLQVACGAGNLEVVQLLLSHGADPFRSTQLADALCYSPAALYGCYSAVAVCCAHGRSACLRALVAGGARAPDVLSLEEVLAEGAAGALAPPPHTKAQQRALHDAMYYAAETDHLELTLELRALGVAWSLHAWTLSLAAAADAGLHHIIDQLLQDFLQVCPSDDSHCSQQFISDCLPLLFNILRCTKKESTMLLVADIVCACYGWEPVPAVSEPPPAAALHPPHPPRPRVDPTYVNNPSLADVTFRVEGRLFYGHKIVLVSESPRLRAMLAPPRASQPATDGAAAAPAASAGATSTPPLVQINDIRYHIFEQVMRYLYSGGCSALHVADEDVLELLAAASFFQLLPLQRHCEARAARAVNLHNLVSVYIHAKVYGATQLLQYCQGFLLQNMVALLTHDESAKRLLFGKRLPGHNVLAALLTTLQARLEARRLHAKGR